LATGYVVLPLVKLYKPIWEYDGKTLAKDLSAYLTFGSAPAPHSDFSPRQQCEAG